MAMQHGSRINGDPIFNASVPPFRPAWWTLPGTFIGGDLQTVLAVKDTHSLPPQHTDFVLVGEGDDADQIALHVNEPSGTAVGNLLLLHGITGCHAAPYMKRLASKFLQLGFRTIRMDARGCGVMKDNAATITHAGRSDDIAAAINFIAEKWTGPIHAIGMSLGGNQVLRMAGRMGANLVAPPAWIDRFRSIAAIAPPVDLPACANNMDRLRNRFYNRYFIAALLKRLPPAIHETSLIAALRSRRLPKTLRNFDDCVTAPLAGFSGVDDYYRQSSAVTTLASINIPTLIVASRDDPIVPIQSFGDISRPPSPHLDFLVTNRGGHAGFLGSKGSVWLVDRLSDWVRDKMIVRSHAPRSPHYTRLPRRHGQSSQERDLSDTQ